MKYYFKLLFLFVLVKIVACTKDEQNLENPVLAIVGEQHITATQLIDFEKRLPQDLRTKKPGLAGYLDYLQTLIDKEIYLQEAIHRGLDKDSELTHKLLLEKEERMLRALMKQDISDKIIIDPQELQDYYDDADKEQEIKLRLIIVNTQQEAQKILNRIQDGEDFSVLARAQSLHQETAPNGGELVGYLTQKSIPLFLHKFIIPLEVGEYSEPIRLPNEQYGIYQVMDSRTVRFASVQGILMAQLKEQKMMQMMGGYIDNIGTDLGMKANTEHLDQLQQWIDSGRRDFTAEERSKVLYQFSNGAIKIEDFLNLAKDLDIGFSDGFPNGVQWFATDVLVPRTLILKKAYQQNIDEDKGILRWHKRRKEALLLLALRQTAVKDQINISEEEIKRLYDERPDLFTPPEEVLLQEIMVKTREEAMAIKARIKAGEDMGRLANEFTVRGVAKGMEGKFHIHTYEQAYYKELIDAAREAEIDRLYGPLAITVQAAQVMDSQAMNMGGEYYSVFKVIESNFGLEPEPLQKVAKRANALLRRAEESRLANEFLIDLRRQRENKITIYEEQLKTLVPN